MAYETTRQFPVSSLLQSAHSVKLARVGNEVGFTQRWQS